jgi:hypothetical protein
MRMELNGSSVKYTLENGSTCTVETFRDGTSKVTFEAAKINLPAEGLPRVFAPAAGIPGYRIAEGNLPRIERLEAEVAALRAELARTKAPR